MFHNIFHILQTHLPLGRAGVLIMSCGTFVSVEGSQLRSQGSSLWRVKPPHDLLAEKDPIPLV